MPKIKLRKNKIKREIDKNIEDFIRDITITLRNELKKEAPVYRGELRQGIHVLNISADGSAVGIKAPYAAAIQNGTKPFYPPIEPLKKWVRRKLGAEESVAYAVQQKIGEEGIDANPFITRAINNLKNKYT